MTGYTRRWDCWICGESNETIDYPRVLVCRKCVWPLARNLCKAELGVWPDTNGVDTNYWELKARGYAETLFKRRPSNIVRT